MTWDDLRFLCGECGTDFTSQSAAQHQIRVDLHLAVHELAEVGAALTTMSPAEALAWAVDVARATLGETPGVALLHLEAAAVITAPN